MEQGEGRHDEKRRGIGRYGEETGAAGKRDGRHLTSSRTPRPAHVALPLGESIGRTANTMTPTYSASHSGQVAAPPSVLVSSSVATNTAIAQVVRDSLSMAALGLGLIYLGTACSHALRLDPPHRAPLALAAGFSAAAYLLMAIIFRARPPEIRNAHRLAALMATVALANETLQQQLLLDPHHQVYTMLYLLAVGVFLLSTRWLVFCIALGWAGWGLAVCRDATGAAAMEWLYAHAAATALGAAFHASRQRTLGRLESHRQADAQNEAQLRQALQELRESEALFRQFADHSGQVFWINDGITHHVAYINRVYETLMGRSIDRLHDDPLDWLGAVHPEDRPRISRAYLDCVNSQVFDERYRLIRSDGAIRWVHDHGFLIGDGPAGARRIGGIMRDVTDRVLAEKQLQLSEQTNRAMLHAIPDMILRVRPDGSFVVVQTPRNFDAQWLRPDRAPKNLLAFLPAELVDTARRQFAAALASGQAQTHEYPWRDETGEHWREWRIAPIGDGEALVIVRDITARKASEHALTSSRQRLSDLIADIDGIVYECDPQTFRFSFVSAHAEKMRGFPLEVWLNRPNFFPDVVHPEDRERIARFCAQSSAKGLDHEMTHRLIAADGRVVWVQDRTRVVKDAEGKPIRLCGILIDISDSMRAAQALRDSQAILDKAQEIAHLGSWTWEPHRDRVIWSPQMYRIHGITPEQFDGSWTQALEMIHPADQQRVWQHCERVIKSREVEPLECRVVRPDGGVRIVSADGELHFDNQGRLHRIIGTVQDITELRAAEAERARLEEELRQVQKLEAVGTLASGVAHDFNNLLTAINGYVDLARQTLPADHPARQSLKMIELATDQAAGVTQGLLTFGHHTPLEKAPIDLAPNIHQSLQLLRRLLPASIELIEDMPEDGEVWVNADGHQLQQIWLNLTVNARDAMPGGGRLIIRLRRITQGPANPQDSWHGHAAETAAITVTDSGTGMSEQTMARIFEPYFTTKPRGQGTGLGLSIVHGIVTDHAGSIRVQSEVGKGTRFTIYLPCCPATQPVAAPGNVVSMPKGHGETILLAEDNEFVRAIISSSLQSAGYKLIAVGDGVEALDAFEAHRDELRLIIFDLDLPRQSGEQCLRRIRGAGHQVPAILITGHVIEAQQEPRFRNEIVLKKPFQVGRLIDVVNEVLCRAEPHP